MTGPALEAEGVERVVDAGDLGAMGVLEVLGRIPAARRALGRLAAEAERRRVAGAILVDAPDFNLRLADRLARHGVPVVQIVSPTVWAWRRGRVETLRRAVRRLLLTLPFETSVYEGTGIDAVYVGNPVLDRVPDPIPPRVDVAERLGLAPGAPWVALLPGSRAAELERLGPIVVEAARRVRQGVPGVEFIVPVAPGVEPGAVAAALAEGPPARLAIERRLEPLAHCAAAIVKSGTGSLELAVLGVPHVVAWATSALTWWTARLLVDVEHVALPNLIAGKRIVPEFLQAAAHPEAIAAPIVTWLRDPAAHRAVVDELEGVRAALGPPGFAERAARAALEALGLDAGGGAM